MISIVELKKEAKFYQDPNAIGTEGYHRLGFSKEIIGTDGVKIMCSRLGCYWLFDVIVSHGKKLGETNSVYLFRNDKNGATFYITDGNEKVLVTQEIDYTDITEDVQLFVQFDGIFHVVMLPSEY